MDLIVTRVVNHPVESNCFIIYHENHSNCIVIDPGSKDCVDLLQILSLKLLTPDLIILTHEHFDHIWGVNKLKDSFHSKILCSKACSEKIINKKGNMSVFYDQTGFETYPPDIQVEDINNQMVWMGNNIQFLSTPGHTPGSICILIGSCLFTGDTIIKNTKTVTKFPGGSKKSLIESLSLLNGHFLNKQIKIFPGHGDSFRFDEIKIQALC